MSKNNSDANNKSSVEKRATSKSFTDLIQLLPKKTKKLSLSFQQTVRQALTPPPGFFSTNSPRKTKSDDIDDGLHVKHSSALRIIPNNREVLTAQLIHFGRSSELLRSLRRKESVDESRSKLVQKYIVITNHTIEILNIDANNYENSIHKHDIIIDLDNVHGISMPFRTIKSTINEDEIAIRTTEVVIHLGHKVRDLWIWCMDNEERASLLDIMTKAIEGLRIREGDDNPLEIDQLSLEEVTDRVVLGVRLDKSNKRIVRSSSSNISTPKATLKKKKLGKQKPVYNAFEKRMLFEKINA